MIILAHAKIEWQDYGCLTTFNDGKSIASIPHWQDHHYWIIASRTGYADDLMAYCREHDLAHCLIAETFFDTPSPVLWGLAHGEPVGPHTSIFEELAAQTVQKWVRANEEPIVGGADWRDLKRKMLCLLEGQE